VLGLVRARGPLPILLWTAAREGRLVRQWDGGFALLEPPLADRGWRPPRGITPVWLRVADRQWDTLVFTGPPAVALAGAVALIPFRALWPLAIAFALYALLHVAVLLTGQTAQAGRWLLRTFGGRPSAEDISVEELPSSHWWLPLCHQENPERMDDLLDLVQERLRQLVTARADQAVRDIGARAEILQTTEILVCLLDGSTSAATRAAMVEEATQHRNFVGGDRLAVLVPPSNEGETRRPSVDAGGFLLIYLGGVVVAVLTLAYMVASWEKAACTTVCAEHPTTYRLAVRWLAERLLLHDPPRLTPLTGYAAVLGWLTSGLAVMAVPVAATAIAHVRRRSREAGERFEEGVSVIKTKVLIVVVTFEERDAVITAVHAANGQTPKLWRVGDHTVFRLGPVNAAEVILVECEQGSMSPSASMLTTQAVIQATRPDYVILTGIAYGLKKDQKLGDVLVANQVRVLDPKKVIDGAAGEAPIELPRGARPDPSPLLLSGARAATYGWTGQKVHVGPMLTLNTLVNSPTLRARLIKDHPDAIGGEMECGGVYAAAAKARVDWLMVKAVSDRGMRKNDSAHLLATDSAASFVVRMIGQGLLDDRPGQAGLAARTAEDST